VGGFVIQQDVVMLSSRRGGVRTLMKKGVVGVPSGGGQFESPWLVLKPKCVCDVCVSDVCRCIEDMKTDTRTMVARIRTTASLKHGSKRN
jgi:hypothetical protein